MYIKKIILAFQKGEKLQGFCNNSSGTVSGFAYSVTAVRSGRVLDLEVNKL